MTDKAVKVIITIKLEGRKLNPKVIDVELKAKLDELILFFSMLSED
jgi:hypothetical protein